MSDVEGLQAGPPERSDMPEVDDPDAMWLRRELSGRLAMRGAEQEAHELATDPVYRGLKMAMRYCVAQFGGLGPEHTICDVGSNDGRPIMRSVGALMPMNERPKVIGVDPSRAAYANYQKLLHAEDTASYMRGFELWSGTAQHIPLQDDEATLTTIFNTIFRIPKAELPESIRQLHRVTRPGGFIVVTSNEEGHAQIRHRLVHDVAREVSRQQSGDPIIVPPPAEGAYFRDLTSLFFNYAEFEVMERVEHTAVTDYTQEGGFDMLAQALRDSFARSGLTHADRPLWDEAVERVMERGVRSILGHQEQLQQDLGKVVKPVFQDTVHTGTLILQVKK